MAGAESAFVFPDPALMTLYLALQVADASAGVAKGFRLAVSGGRSPVALLDRLAKVRNIDWPDVELFFTDERAAPPEHADSNYRLVREHLLDPLGERAPRVFRMRGEAEDLEAAAREYERDLEARLHLLLLGVGEDGHIASLFPGSPLLEERERRVAVVGDSPKPPARRLTITPRTIEEARRVFVIATGAAKRDAVARALAPAGEVRECPARLVRERSWFLDPEAAAGLPRDSVTWFEGPRT